MEPLRKRRLLAALDNLELALNQFRLALGRAGVTASHPTQAELTKKFRYDDALGNLVWLAGHAAGQPLGGKMTTLDDEGFPVASMSGVKLRIASLVWCFHHDEWEPDCIVPIDGDPLNVAIENLHKGSAYQ